MSEQNEKPLQENGHVGPRDFKVVSCEFITSAGQSRQIASMVAEIQVRQDMYLGFMSGEMLVTDGVDLLTQSAAHGGEYIWLHLQVPEQSIEVKKAFRVYKIGKRSPKDDSQQYVVYFVSDEAFVSQQKAISKAYQNLTLSDIAFDIMNKQLKIPTNRIFIDKTAIPVVSTIIPNWRPAEALNWLASRAYTDTQTCYFFYENLLGFHFRSLQALYKQPKIIKVPFTFDNKRGMKQLDMDKFAIDDYEAVHDFDILSTIASGGYAMRLNTVDPIARSLQKQEYSLEGLSKLYPNAPMSNGGDLMRKTNSHLLTYLAGDGIEVWIQRVMSLAALNNNLTEITVPGNLGINAGTLVSLRIPLAVQPAQGDMWNKMKSGKYLCMAVNHKFDLANFTFSSRALLSRDSLPEALPAYDSTLPDKINKLNAK
jgi:hypothetical protein